MNFPGSSVKDFLKEIPSSSGVYVMKDKNDAALYIGKARNIRNRLRSYFRPSGLSHRIEKVMQQVTSIETIVTRTETEALLLENNLIKTNQPQYNIRLRDDKSYPYIYLDDAHEFPKLEFYRGNRKELGQFFGPFSSAAAVRQTLSQLQKVFPVRQCRDSFFRHRSRPCLQYQIDRCTAPCVGLIDSESYAEDVDQAVEFLSGKNQELNQMLIQKMEESAKNLEFELAAKYRDRISAIQRLREMQSVDGKTSDLDVIALIYESGILCIQMVICRSGRNIDYKTYFPKISVNLDLKEALSEFIPQYYLKHELPPLILVDRKIEDSKLFVDALLEKLGRHTKIHCPIHGEKVKLIDLARKNAHNAVERQLRQRKSLQSSFDQLIEILKLDEELRRIECFDVSHTAGERPVASCVVFDTAGPVKAEYRTFNIAAIQPGDDYDALRQALTRRYRSVKEGEGRLPELILIDGGKGQLQACVEVMDELQLANVQLVAISKGPERKPGREQIWVPDRTGPVKMSLPALTVLQQIRDEAHRFALLGHRGRRSRARKKSVLESIPGIGNRRRAALLNHFGGLQGVARADLDELRKVKGISLALAEKVYSEFHSEF